MQSIQTNNMMIDILLENLKILIKGTVLKNETIANNNETLESIKNGDLLVSCVEQTVTFNMLEYNYEVLSSISINPSIIDLCISDKNKIPLQFRDMALDAQRKYYIDNYKELNNYYRMLAGLPNIGDDGIKIFENVTDVDTTKYLHEMTNAEIDILDALGIIENIMYQYPDKKYLIYLKNSRIDVYKSRKAQKFALLYIPPIQYGSIGVMYKNKIELNRVYTLKTIYSEAFKYGSDYYDNFIELFIKIQAMVDVILNTPELLIKRDLFDDNTIRYLFESHGIDYFDSIPRKFQIAMLKNLNTLLAFKSTTKNLVDICSLFGFNNIELFKYYLLKDRKVVDGNYSNVIIGDNILLFIGGLFKTRYIEYELDQGVISKTDEGLWEADWTYEIIIPENAYIYLDYGTIGINQTEINIELSNYIYGDTILFFKGGVYQTLDVDYTILSNKIIKLDNSNWELGKDYDMVMIKGAMVRNQNGVLETEQDAININISDYTVGDNILLFIGGLLQTQGVEYNVDGINIYKQETAVWQEGVAYDIFIIKDIEVKRQSETFTEENSNIQITIPGYNESGEDLQANYDLKFVKVPITSSVDDYMRNPSFHLDYDEIVNQDPYWDGDSDHDDIKRTILDQEFNIVKSKYLSIDTIYDMNNLSFELCYMFNFIKSNKDLENNLILKVRYINQDKYFKLIDIISYLYVLMYENIGITDSIMDTTSKVLTIKGFNFDADLPALEEYLRQNNYTFEDVGIQDFQIPDAAISSFETLMDVFIRNKNIYDHISDQLVNANDIRTYRIYKKIYDALMVTELNNSIFVLPDGTFAGTYSRYLEASDPVLFQHIEYIRTLSGNNKTNIISETITEILFSLDNYIDTSNFEFLFTGIPSLSSELLKGYVYKVIDFFKSYKTELLSINIVYKLDDRLDNKIMIIDGISDLLIHDKHFQNYGFHFADSINYIKVKLDKEETVSVRDSVTINSYEE